MVPEAGLEPAQGCPYRILSPARLPFHHSGTVRNSITYNSFVFNHERRIFRIQAEFKRQQSLLLQPLTLVSVEPSSQLLKTLR